MNYEAHYNTLIERAKNRLLECYTERHHVVPKCMGGSDDAENIVRLTPEEHYVAHQLLVKMYPSNVRLVYALNLMSGNKIGERNNKSYGWIRRQVSKARLGGTPWNKGKKGSQIAWNKGRICGALSSETKVKISKTLTGRKNNWGHKISKARIGMKRAPFSDEWKRKLGDATRGIEQPKLICPHCNKTGGQSNMKRYHFNKCKVAV